MTSNTVQQIMNKPDTNNVSSDGDSSDSRDSRQLQSSEVLKRLNSRKDPLFFEFFSIYTAQSVKQKLVAKKF